MPIFLSPLSARMFEPGMGGVAFDSIVPHLTRLSAEGNSTGSNRFRMKPCVSEREET